MKSTSKEDEIISSLSAVEADTRLRALRALKNVVIGDKRKKGAFLRLGAVQMLVQILSADRDAELAVQAATALGSFAAWEEGWTSVVEHGGIPQLLRALNSREPKLVEAAVRSLKMIYKNPQAPKQEVFEGGIPHRLITLLSLPQGSAPEAAACVIATCCETPQQQEAMVAAGAVPPLVHLLAASRHQNRQQAALGALASLTSGSPSATAACLSQEGALPAMLGFLKHAHPYTRYLACASLANLCLSLGEGGEPSRKEVEHAVLPVLVRLLGECGGERGEDVPSVLCQLVAESAELQRAATDADSIAKLAVFVRDPACPAARKGGALRALGLLCATAEANRRQLLECRVLPQLTAALMEPCPRLRAAACMCMRSLSRSTNLLRSNLGEVDVAAPLLKLTEGEDADVAWQAAAALANLTVDCSAVKEAVLHGGGVRRFLSLTQSMDTQLRLYGVWGLSSIAFRSSAEVRDAIMQHMPWDHLAALLEDPEPDIREKSLLLLRNLAYNSSHLHHQSQRQERQQREGEEGEGLQGGKPSPPANSLQTWSRGAVLPAVKAVLQRPHPSSALKEHALYVVVNMASGSEEQKGAVMAHGWTELLLCYMGDQDPKVREAAVWAVINLSWSKEGDRAAPFRIQAMREQGLEEKLRHLQHDDCLPVKERAQTALLQFSSRDEPDTEMQQAQDSAVEAAATAAANTNASLLLRMHFRD